MLQTNLLNEFSATQTFWQLAPTAEISTRTLERVLFENTPAKALF